MDELPYIVKAAVHQAEDHQAQLISSVIETLSCHLQELSEDNRKQIELHMRAKLQSSSHTVYIGGMAVGVACGKNNVNPMNLLPREMLREPIEESFLTVLQGGKVGDS